MNSPSPSPLVPQGSIAPKHTSRSKRVLLIGSTVALLHVGGLGLVLFQGCKKDALNTAGAETNATTAPLTLPTLPDTNTFYTSASSVPPPASTSTALVSTQAPLVAAEPPGASAAGTMALQEPPVTPEAPAGPETDYKIAPGDTLSKVASRNKVSLSALLKSNPNVDPKKLKIGQTLKIPAPAAPGASAAAPAGTQAATAAGTETAGSAGGTYKVKPGDNLSRIARAHGVTVNQLKAANNLRTTQILPGRVLKIPAKAATATAGGTQTNQ